MNFDYARFVALMRFESLKRKNSISFSGTLLEPSYNNIKIDQNKKDDLSSFREPSICKMK